MMAKYTYLLTLLSFETLGFWFATLQSNCTLRFASGTNDSWAANQNPRASNDNNALKMNMINILTKTLTKKYCKVVPYLRKNYK